MARRLIPTVLLTWLALLLTSVVATAQQPSTGFPPLGTFAGSPDAVDLANLNVNLTIPVFSKAGVGMPLSYSLHYNSLVWVPTTSGNSTYWEPIDYNVGWGGIAESITGYISYGYYTTQLCYYTQGGVQYLGGTTITWSEFAYHDPAGGIHPFSGTVINWTYIGGSCHATGWQSITAANPNDNSGYLISVGQNGSGALGAVVKARGGLTIVPPILTIAGSGPPTGSVTDANGNQISISSSGVVTDTLGDVGSGGGALTISGSAPSPVTFSYTAPSGAQPSVTVSYVHYSIQTCFEVPGIEEYSPAVQLYLVDKVTFPDTSYYQFHYETTVGCGASGTTTGRISSVTLPTGGEISYSYSGSGSNCYNDSNCMMADGGPSSMTRSFSGFGSWTYTRAVQSGQQLPQTSTTVIDASGNETDLNFSGVYVTQDNVYNGNGTSKSLLKNVIYCYNGNFTSCQTAAVTPPITQQWLYDKLTDSGLYKTSVQSYDQYGNVTGESDYGYITTGSPPVIRNLGISYNSTLCGSPTYICDHPSSVQVNSASGQVGLTNYSYNGTGNTTEVQRWVSGSSYLTSYYSYNGNGTVSTATDPNSTVTSYSYSGSSCDGAFPTSLSVAGLTTKYQYNCIGAVVTAATDPNNATSSSSYTDPYFWRPASTTDALGNVTHYNYYEVNNAGTSPALEVTQTESVLTFNSSTVDSLNTVDGFGRLSLSQVREGPGSSTWDTIEYLYNNSGQVSWVTLPFSDSAGTIQGDLPSTGYSYDGLGRYVDIQSPWSGIDTHYTYSLNDVEVTVNPAPAGEHAKSHQYEYDALGRLTSVCEMTSMSGSGSCPQQHGQTGFYTSYTYDPRGDLEAVTQSTQSRTYNYDGLGRMISEGNPESGTTTYTYDSIGASYCAGAASTSPGDLTGKADAAGNHLCYYYDGLHRLTAIGNNNQSATNPCLRFAYDNSTGVKGSYPPGISPTYYWGRMVEAETDNCGAQGDPTITDEWFSYNARGDKTDAWESTPNSAGWYHSQNQYAANGATSGRFGYLGTGTSTPFTNALGYALDGEGRLNGLLDTTVNQWLWEGTTYNAASQPNQLQFYSGDSESFSWDTACSLSGDPNCGRMNSWTSKVGALQQKGTLTWNANGTLQKLAITDTANSGNAQTCANLYDDLERVSSNLCSGSLWGQDFNYDVFGNITKTVPAGYTGTIFDPGYDSGNRVSGYSYDTDGDVTNDGDTLYTYNIQGRPASVSGLGITGVGVYDAFNRLVEWQTSPGGDTQLVYAPDAYKFAYMNGQAVTKYIAPLAAGLQAVYTAATPSPVAYWRHADWLGSSRLASTASQQMYFDGAYAPFGELYAGAGTSNWSNWSFTGQTMDLGNDSVTGIFDFPLRQQSPNQGRWLVPDPAGMAAVDITNPQTWNRYAYVGNNPLSNVDPLGLYRACFRVAWSCTWETDQSGNTTGAGGIEGLGSTSGTPLANLWWGPGEFQLMTLPVYTYGWIGDNYSVQGPNMQWSGGATATSQIDYLAYWGLIDLGTMATFPGSLNLLNWSTPGTAEEAFNRRYPDPTKPSPPQLPMVSNQPLQIQPAWPSAFEQVQTCAAMAPLSGPVPGLSETADMSPVLQEWSPGASFPVNPVGNSQGNAAGGGAALIGNWAACGGLQPPN